MAHGSVKKLAVFVSGSGTNLENLADSIRQSRLKNCEIRLVVTDNPQAKALERSKRFNLKSQIFDRKDFKTKADFENAILGSLKAEKIDFVVLAGFMRILSPEFIRAYPQRIVNIHPALLPKFPGAHAIQDAWNAKAKETGVTVHFVDEGIDTGPVIFQKKVVRLDSDTLESLEQKIHAAEYEVYPLAVQWLVDGKLKVVNGKVVNSCAGEQVKGGKPV